MGARSLFHVLRDAALYYSTLPSGDGRYILFVEIMQPLLMSRLWSLCLLELQSCSLRINSEYFTLSILKVEKMFFDRSATSRSFVGCHGKIQFTTEETISIISGNSRALLQTIVRRVWQYDARLQGAAEKPVFRRTVAHSDTFNSL